MAKNVIKISRTQLIERLTKSKKSLQESDLKRKKQDEKAKREYAKKELTTAKKYAESLERWLAGKGDVPEEFCTRKWGSFKENSKITAIDKALLVLGLSSDEVVEIGLSRGSTFSDIFDLL